MESVNCKTLEMTKRLVPNYFLFRSNTGLGKIHLGNGKQYASHFYARSTEGAGREHENNEAKNPW